MNTNDILPCLYLIATAYLSLRMWYRITEYLESKEGGLQLVENLCELSRLRSERKNCFLRFSFEFSLFILQPSHVAHCRLRTTISISRADQSIQLVCVARRLRCKLQSCYCCRTYCKIVVGGYISQNYTKSFLAWFIGSIIRWIFAFEKFSTPLALFWHSPAV